MFRQLGLIGCGLMGGSFALAMKRAGLVKHVVGYSKSPSTVIAAQKMGVIDQMAESALMAVSGADIVLIAVPVAATEATLRAIRHLVHPNTLFMDVGSTKANVVEAARRVLRERLPSFVPAHPIAGKEAAGITHADATLYSGRQVILTPLAQTAPELLQKATDTWAAIGAQVLRMTPENHDAAFGAVSHLPHMLAFAYFNSVARQPAGKDYLSLAGGPTRGADADSIFVIHANGSVDSALQDSSFWHSGVDSFKNLRIVAGDTIFVPEQVGKATFIQDAKDWTQILYQFGLGLAGINALGL